MAATAVVVAEEEEVVVVEVEVFYRCALVNLHEDAR
jgi:hypothetical protein